ncbi:hypothetical protein [Pseudomonas typographi]|uniref:N-acetyltransferase domain-containing protein n=1 Tax=Pseudomonas typographi TaxID=2715964 RepID=A0ABR7Z0X1_9PSED|nr:hypothetical protein [Pseudomonas typographi]MBD1553385.1 hypothetical protein [Pseudomonas typographi]MBD1588743.1 hypothetical protein [Pseudomonas typographi]MBD1599082.1 hypothetical protein [Pseudomonas typographi]
MTDTPVDKAPATESPAAEPAPGRVLPWGDVLPEHFQLLRLLALPSDRISGPRPLRFMQAAHAERHGPQYSLLRMEVQVPGQHVRKEQNRLDVWVDHEQQVAWSEPATLNMEPANRGLGRYLLAQAAGWLQKRWPHYRIEGQELPNRDAIVENTRLRRDHVLRVHGFDVEYADPQHLKGRYRELKVNQLLPQWNTEKVQPVDILDAATLLQAGDQHIQELENTLRKRDEHIAKYRREDGSLRFTIVCLIAFAVFQAGLLIWMATHR